ncbi:transporter [Roseomonas sp. ACRSG]|nr:transporter [Roseomonas sp. ACRSG]
MHGLFQFLESNPYILLFLVVGLAVGVGRVSLRGYGLGMVASAIVVGCGLSAWAAANGVALKLDDFTKSLFYYLFMYGVGLRVGPSFLNSLNRDAIAYTILAVVSCVVGGAIVVAGAVLLDLPQGVAGGMLAGSQTMSAAIGSAEQAITSGAVALRPGTSVEDVSAMIALSYGITYIWGTVGIILICKYLPRWWGMDARALAREYEAEHGVNNVDEAGLTAYRPTTARAYRLDNDSVAGLSVHDFRQRYPMYRVANIRRAGQNLGADPELVMRLGDIVVLGGPLGEMTDRMGLIGPEVADSAALTVPLDQGTILLTHPEAVGRQLGDYARSDLAGQIQLTAIERGGHPVPIGTQTRLRRGDLLSVIGSKAALSRASALLGPLARPSTATDLLTLCAGMILGFLIGLIQFPAFGSNVGLGNAGGLLLSGIIVSALVSRLRYFGNTPNAARNILEDMGLVVFVAIVGVNSGGALVTQLNGTLALSIFIIGFLACSVPPFIVWVLGLYLFRIHPVLLMGATAGARSHSGPAREAAAEAGSSVPWLGFPVGYAVSGVLLTVGGYFVMLFAG